MNQAELEELFSKSKAREYVYNLLLSEDYGMDVVVQGIDLLKAWTTLPSKYEKKQVRRDTLASMDIQEIVEKVFVEVLMMRKPTTLANMATTLGMSLGFQEAKEGITLAGEILAVLCNTGFYTIMSRTANSSLYIVPNTMLDDEERIIAERGMYMPPMIEKPKKLTDNRSSPYQTVTGQSLILKAAHKHHDFDICLDVLNRQNSIPLELDIDFINNVEEEATFDLDTIKGIENYPPPIAKEMIRLQRMNWEMHLEQSNFVYQTMADEGNRFYVTNKYDNRGRLYSQGHHINPIGTSYKKASINLANKEKINVPTGFFS